MIDFDLFFLFLFPNYLFDFQNSKEALENEIEKINKNLTKVENIKKYFVIKENFTIENGMMTPTLKLKRFKIINKYKKEFENLYLSLS